MHSEKPAQIRVLVFNKAFSEVMVEYSNYNNVFLIKNAAELPENTRINEHAIKLEEGKQQLFRPIYNLRSVELKILNTYIKTNIANGFIWPSKSLIKAHILFDKKPNRSLHFYVDY